MRKTAIIKGLLVLLGLLPLALLLLRGFTDQLGSDPVKALTHATGLWALRLLLLTLTITPLKRILRRPGLLQYRRTLGLLTFFYASLHLLVYIFIDLGLYWPQVIEDVVKRPYITVGFSALMLMSLLAATSNAAMMRRLGPNWKRLHRLIYLIAGLALLHFLWLVKKDLMDPLLYTGYFTLLMLYRAWYRWGR